MHRKGDVWRRRGGTTSTSPTSKSCPGQCFHPSPTTDQGVDHHHQISPRQKDAPRERSQTESRVQAGHTHIFPAEARPILLAAYVCPTDAYKGAQHVCREGGACQTGRHQLVCVVSTCPPCVSGARAPFREPGRSRNSVHPVHCPTRNVVFSFWAGPTELLDTHLTQAQSNCLCWSGTSSAPSRFDRPAQELRGSLSTYSVRDRAWDKIPRIGEAKNPGPEPPRELYLDSKNGQRDPIRLCTQNGG